MGGQVQCVTKQQFYSENVAQNRADQINFDLGYEKIFVYRCNCCQCFHLTRTKTKDK